MGLVVASKPRVRADFLAGVGIDPQPVEMRGAVLGSVLAVEPMTGALPVPGLFAAGNATDISMTLMASAAHGMRVGAFVNAGGTYEVAPKISARAALGFGVTLLGGLQDGNPFTPAGSSASGTLAMPLVRAGLTGEYAITPNVAAAVTPINFSFSPPKDGMRDDIDSVTRIEFMVGVGYRM